MSWIDNLINQGRQQITNAVNTGINTVQNAGQNIVSGAQQMIENVTSGYGDWVAAGNNTQPTQTPVQAPVQTTPTVTPATMPVQAPVQTTPTATPQTTPTTTTATAPTGTTATAPTTTVQPEATTPATTPAPEQMTAPTGTTPTTSEGVTTAAPVTGFDTYEDYLGNNTKNINNIYQNTIDTIDKQSADMLSALDEKLAAGNEYAGERLESNLNYNTKAYDQTVANIKQLYETGKITAEKARELILTAAEEAKNLTYESAERQRQEAEASADVARQRAITDANSAYEQNKSGYGAKAEAMASMGLTGGGYADWLDASAYAQNRAETQAARAESDRVKREAKYNEDMTKLEADLLHSEKKTQAELEYIKKMGELDTSYAANMGEAEQDKLEADKKANDTYKGQLYENEAEYKQGVLETQQAADSAKLTASNDYIKAIMENEGELAKFRESVAAGDKEAQQVQLALFEQVLSGVSNGTYSKEVAEALANAYGFNEEWKSQISTAGDTYNTKISTEEAEAKIKESGEKFVGLLDSIASGAFDGYTKEEIKTIAANAGVTLTDDQMALVNTALTNRQNGINETDAEYKNGIYNELLTGAKKGLYTEAEIADFVTRYGLDESMASNLTTAVQTYNTEQANAKAEQEQANKMANFTDLLGRVNSGQLTKDEVLEIAKGLGFDATKDATQLALLGAAADRFASGTEEDKKLAKTNSFIALLDSANSGTYNAEQIKELATQLGFDANNPDDKRLIDMLAKGATAFADEKTAAELKADTEYMNGLYVELMTAANSGDLTETQIRDIAGRFGFKGEDLDNLGAAAKAYADKKALEEELLEKGTSSENKSTILEKMADGSIGLDITDSDIDKWVKEDILTTEDAEELKTERNEMITEELEYYAQNGYTTEAVDKVEKLVEKGIIDKNDDVYQKAYFDVGLYDAQNLNSAESIVKYKNTLDKYKSEGKISEEDYNSLMDYVYKSSAKTIDGNKTHISYFYADNGITEFPTIQIGDQIFRDVWLKSEEKADENLKTVLDYANNKNSNENLVLYDGKVYIKSKLYGWCPVNNEDVVKAYTKIVEVQPNVSTPKHTKKETPKTSNTGSSGGTSGGGSGLSKPVDNHFGLANR